MSCAVGILRRRLLPDNLRFRQLHDGRSPKAMLARPEPQTGQAGQILPLCASREHLILLGKSVQIDVPSVRCFGELG